MNNMNFAVKRKTYTEDIISVNFDGMQNDAGKSNESNFMPQNQGIEYEGENDSMRHEDMRRQSFMNENQGMDEFQGMRDEMPPPLEPRDRNNNFPPPPNQPNDYKNMKNSSIGHMKPD